MDMKLLSSYTSFAQQHLRFNLTLYANIAHPAWYINLFHADLIGTLFKQEMNKCFIHEDKTSTTLASHEMRASLIPHVKSEQPRCDPAFDPIIDLSASTIASGSYLGIGRYQSEPTNESWTIQQDRPGRFGWIVEKGNFSTKLLFYPQKPPKVPINRGVIMFLRYLRTYQNAGQMNVYIGDITHPQLFVKAYWDKKMSMTQSKHITISPTINYSIPLVTLNYCPEGNGEQKIKINSVKVCYLPEGES